MQSNMKIRVWHIEHGGGCGVTVYCQAGWPCVTDGPPLYGGGTSIRISEATIERIRENALISPMREGAAKSFWRSVLQKDAMRDWWEIEYPYGMPDDAEACDPIDLIGGWPDIEGELEYAEACRRRDREIIDSPWKHPGAADLRLARTRQPLMGVGSCQNLQAARNLDRTPAAF